MKIRQWHIYVIYLLAASAVLTGISLSRFTTTLANTGTENTVPPDIEFSTWVLEYASTGVSLEGMLPGDSRTIAIRVENWAWDGVQERLSGYDQNVILALTTTGNLPLSFTLTKDGEGEISLNRRGAFLYESAAQHFSAGVKETKDYILTVYWPASSRDYSLKDEIDYLELKLRAMQS